MKSLAIALNTFRETRRDRAQWVLLLYAAILVGSAYVLSPLALGEGYRVTRDLGLAALSVVGLLLIVLLGGGLVHKEIERRTILTVLAKPIRRSEFLAGKYLGLLSMVGSVFLSMVAVLALVLWLKEGRVEPAVLWAAGFTFGEFAIMTAVVVSFSAFVSPVLSAVFSFAVFVSGHFAEDLLRFADKAPSEAMAFLARGLYWCLPHLELYNLRAEAAYGIVPDPGRLAAALAYTVLYTTALLIAGSVIMSRREFR
jgi:ABC-type transport system involved in multi-copper enzyme maturation permease subunit